MYKINPKDRVLLSRQCFHHPKACEPKFQACQHGSHWGLRHKATNVACNFDQLSTFVNMNPIFLMYGTIQQ
jgi:hypothetical protein